MSYGFPKDSLADYIDQHTGCAESTWNQTDPAQKGLCPFVPANCPNKSEFLKLIYAHGRGHPLDDQEHDLPEIRQWLGEESHGLALRIIALRSHSASSRLWRQGGTQPKGFLWDPWMHQRSINGSKNGRGGRHAGFGAPPAREVPGTPHLTLDSKTNKGDGLEWH